MFSLHRISVYSGFGVDRFHYNVFAIWFLFLLPDGLRRLFCTLNTQPYEDGESLIEKLILSDTQMWKGKSLTVG